MAGLSSYHYAWLAAHPWRTKEWLISMLADGFHIHHVDGDHSNDDPRNLVLIDGVDHMRLHGMSLRDGLRSIRGDALDLGAQIYAARITPMSWRDAALSVFEENSIGSTTPAAYGLSLARKYASATGKIWPPPAPSFSPRPKGRTARTKMKTNVAHLDALRKLRASSGSCQSLRISLHTIRALCRRGFALPRTADPMVGYCPQNREVRKNRLDVTIAKEIIWDITDSGRRFLLDADAGIQGGTAAYVELALKVKKLAGEV